MFDLKLNYNVFPTVEIRTRNRFNYLQNQRDTTISRFNNIDGDYDIIHIIATSVINRYTILPRHSKYYSKIENLVSLVLHAGRLENVWNKCRRCIVWGIIVLGPWCRLIFTHGMDIHRRRCCSIMSILPHSLMIPLFGVWWRLMRCTQECAITCSSVLLLLRRWNYRWRTSVDWI